jgi:hypothetical protein
MGSLACYTPDTVKYAGQPPTGGEQSDEAGSEEDKVSHAWTIEVCFMRPPSLSDAG